MSRKKFNKKMFEFDFAFNDVLVCQDNKFKPFIEFLIQEPENVEQQGLGTLFGIFEVSDHSEDSSYITNYLISIIKKEYFSKPKRGAIESLEAALHKANLGLSKLAEHGNVNWIGKLNIVCAVLERYNLHLTQAGSCHAFLLRAKSLTNISEDLSEPENELSPLKTFVNVSSGKIEDQDKLIITTDNIFDIFSLEEIKKSANKFSEAEFVQFLKTAAVNELERAAVLVIDIKKKEELLPEKNFFYDKPEKINAFSSSSFARTIKQDSEKNQFKEKIEEVIEKSKEEFEDKKTGHIYIKEMGTPPVKTSFPFPDFSFHLKNFLQFIFESVKKSLSAVFLKFKSFRFEINLNFLKKICLAIFAALRFLGEKTATLSHQTAAIAWIFLKEFSAKIKTAISKKESFPVSLSESLLLLENPAKKSFLLPNFSKIRNLISSFNHEQKIYATIVVFLIFFVPYASIKIGDKLNQKKNVAEIVNIIPETVPLEQDKNITRIESLSTLEQEKTILKIIKMNGLFFSVSDSELVDLQKNEKISFPEEFGAIDNSIGMDDLNLIFLTNQKREIFSFSPTSRKFQANLITMPPETKIVSLGTYLTYLYVLDSRNNQIYRYPRAEGGFGEKTDWAKDALDLTQASNMAVNENIFIAAQNEILKLLKGKKQEFSIEETATPISFDRIYVSPDSSQIYILDKINSRIVKTDSQGSITNQFYNEKLHQAQDFSVDENHNLIYFANNRTIYSFNLEQ